MIDAEENASSRMRSSFFGRFVVRFYNRLPRSSRWLKLATRWEGGQLYSISLRAVLHKFHDVELGSYSYGSLCEPGMADRGTKIGSYVSVGPNARRIGAAHPLTGLSLHPFWYNPALGFVGKTKDVHRTQCAIESDSWIGANVVILPGCERIGIGAVVGAGSIVTHDVDDFAIVAGNPARQIGSRLSRAEQEELRTREPWNCEPRQAQKIIEKIAREKPKG